MMEPGIQNIRRIVAAGGDIALLNRDILGIGGQLLGVWDWRFGLSVSDAVDAWVDSIRGVSLTGTTTQRPSYAAGVITFNGTANRLRSNSGVISGSTGIAAACGLAYIGTLPSTAGSAEPMAFLGQGSGLEICTLRRASSNGNFEVVSGSGSRVTATRAAQAGLRVFHGRRTAASGGNITVGAAIGTGSEGTTTAASSDQAGNSLTIGANQPGTGSFADTTCKAIVLIRGDYSAAMRALINTWAQAIHGAPA